MLQVLEKRSGQTSNGSGEEVRVGRNRRSCAEQEQGCLGWRREAQDSCHPRSLWGRSEAQGAGGAMGPEVGEGSLGASGMFPAVQPLGTAGIPAGSEKPVFKDCCGLDGSPHTHPLCHVGILAQAKSMCLIPAMTPIK